MVEGEFSVVFEEEGGIGWAARSWTVGLAAKATSSTSARARRSEGEVMREMTISGTGGPESESGADDIVIQVFCFVAVRSQRRGVEMERIERRGGLGVL